MNNRNLKITIVVLAILVLGLTGYIVYDKAVLKSNVNTNDINNNEVSNQDTTNKIYIKRNGVTALEEVPSDVVGKYVNKEAKDDYFILQSDGTAMVSYPTGGNAIVTNDQLTFQLTYIDGGILALELYTTSGNQPYSPIRIGAPYAGPSGTGYTFSTIEHTPTANAGEPVYEKVEK